MRDDTFFSGGVFSELIDGGRAGADIELAHDELVATTPDGDQFRLRYSECRIEIGGFNDRMVFCRNSDRSLTIFCEDRRFADSLAHAAAGLLDEQLQETRQHARSRAWRGRGLAVTLVVASVLLLVGLYFGIRIGGSAAVEAMPISVDRQIGEYSFESMDLGGEEILDEKVVQPLQSMVDRLAPHAAIPELQFDVHVVQSEMVNAFALPGGVIVVYTGLITQSEQPEQVAGVLAHEMAHATKRHGLQRLSQSLGLAAATSLLLGDVDGLVVLGAELFQLATINSYSRDQETEADTEGVRMLHAAAIDPLGLAQFFEIMKEQGDELPGGLAWISTHPEHDARIANVRSQAVTLGAQDYEPLEIDWEALKNQLNQQSD